MGYMYEALLMSRFKHADTPNPITQSLYYCLGEVLNIHHYHTKVMLLSNQHRYRVQVEFNSQDILSSCDASLNSMAHAFLKIL